MAFITFISSNNNNFSFLPARTKRPSFINSTDKFCHWNERQMADWEENAHTNCRQCWDGWLAGVDRAERLVGYGRVRGAANLDGIFRLSILGRWRCAGKRDNRNGSCAHGMLRVYREYGRYYPPYKTFTSYAMSWKAFSLSSGSVAIKTLVRSLLLSLRYEITLSFHSSEAIINQNSFDKTQQTIAPSPTRE